MYNNCRTCTLYLHVCVVAMQGILICVYYSHLCLCVLMTSYMIGMYTDYDLIIMYDIKYEQTIQLYT